MGFWVLHFIFKHSLSHVRGFDLGIPSTLLSTLAPQDQIDKPLEQKPDEKIKTDQGPQVVTWRCIGWRNWGPLRHCSWAVEKLIHCHSDGSTLLLRQFLTVERHQMRRRMFLLETEVLRFVLQNGTSKDITFTERPRPPTCTSWSAVCSLEWKGIYVIGGNGRLVSQAQPTTLFGGSWLLKQVPFFLFIPSPNWRPPRPKVSQNTQQDRLWWLQISTDQH